MKRLVCRALATREWGLPEAEQAPATLIWTPDWWCWATTLLHRG